MILDYYVPEVKRDRLNCICRKHYRELILARRNLSDERRKINAGRNALSYVSKHAKIFVILGFKALSIIAEAQLFSLIRYLVILNFLVLDMIRILC